MWDKRRLLLTALIFTALCYKVKAKLLETSPDALDDLYNGCRDKALEKFIHSGLLKQELKDSKGFQKAWSVNTQCTKLIPGGIKEHTAALLAYMNGDVDFLRTFNNAVETMGVNMSTYINDFHFKSLHFLLMDSVKLLNPKTCKAFYFLTEEKNMATNGSKVQLREFTVVQSSFRALEKLEDLDGLVVFNVTSCFFANLGQNICSDEDTALLSPSEEFTVEEVKTVADENDSVYTLIVLKHSKLDSSQNCFIFSRSPAGVSTQLLLLVLVALSLFIFNC